MIERLSELEIQRRLMRVADGAVQLTAQDVLD